MGQGGAPELVASPEIKPKFPCQSDAENKVLKILKVRSQKKSVASPMQKKILKILKVRSQKKSDLCD